jgi:hypothetical protein
MEELIFFGVIIFFSIIESIARSRKKRARGPVQIPKEWEEEEQQGWQPEPTPTYDEEPSYDELSTREASSRGSGSEGMVPSEVWEEIVGLAQGRMRQLERKPEPPAVPRPAPSSVTRAGQGVRAEHRVHRSHQEYGTDPSSRAPSAEDGLDPLARTLGEDAATVRRQIRRGGRHALRQAMVLQEILGPPSSMRP